MRVLIFFIVLAAALPIAVYAHGSGASLEKSVPPYVIDIGYDPPKPVAGDRFIFDFSLRDAVSSSTVPFDYVWVRLERENRTYLATGITKAEFGPTSLLYAIPTDVEGDLTLSVRYQRGEKALAEAEFAIPIEKRPTLIMPGLKDMSEYMPWLVAILGGFVAGIGVFAGYARLKKRVV